MSGDTSVQADPAGTLVPAARIGLCQKPHRHPGRTFANGAVPPLTPAIPFLVPRNDLLGSTMPASATSNYPAPAQRRGLSSPCGGTGALSSPAAQQGHLTLGPPPSWLGDPRGPASAALGPSCPAPGAGDTWVSRIIINLFESCSRS